MKYRIKRIGDLYHPQVRRFFVWMPISLMELDLGDGKLCFIKADAIGRIELHKQSIKKQGDIEIIPYVDSSERGLPEVNTKTPMPPVRPQVKVWISGQGKKRSNQQERRNEQKTK